MKFICDYSEFDSNEKTSLLDNISTVEIENKRKVLKYLKNREPNGMQCHTLFDYVSKKDQLETVYVYTDGEYYWSSEETYHFEKYNMKLNDDFIEKVLKH